MPESKKRKFQRKNKKRYEMVTFTSDLFEDDFTLPSIKQMPMDTATHMNRGNFAPFRNWLVAANVDREAVDAVLDLDADEFDAFQKAWSEGRISVPKSSD